MVDSGILMYVGAVETYLMLDSDSFYVCIPRYSELGNLFRISRP